MTLRYGGWEIQLLDCGSLDLPAEALGPGFDDPTPTPVFASLWRGHGRTALVDAGSGPIDELWPGGAGLPAALERAGVEPGRDHRHRPHAPRLRPRRRSARGQLARLVHAGLRLDARARARRRPRLLGHRRGQPADDRAARPAHAARRRRARDVRRRRRGPARRARPLGARALHRALRPGGRRATRACCCTWPTSSTTRCTSSTRSGISSTIAGPRRRSRRGSRCIAEAEARGAVVLASHIDRPGRIERRDGRATWVDDHGLTVMFAAIDGGWIEQ